MLTFVVAAALSVQLPHTRNKCVSSDACWPDVASLRALNELIIGDVVLPGDRLWSKAKHIKNPRLKITPGAVVMSQSSSDVVAAIKYAASANLELSVKSSGHCYSGNCMTEGSLHIDLTRMNKIDIDTHAMELRVQPGTNYKAMYELCDSHDVLMVGGMCPTVGPVGFTLGGGHGPLVRSYGLGVDSLLAVELVTASAEVVNVTAKSNPDLFWALSGGGGGAFGIVVGMHLRVYKAPSQMVSLSCAWPLSHSSKRVGEPILEEWTRDIMPNLPDAWDFYTVAMKEPLGPKVSKWNPFTMNGLLILEGLYNGPYSKSMLDSVGPLLALGKKDQLKCEFNNYSSFKKWHDQAWFASEGPIPFRTFMASSFAQPGFNRSMHATLVTDTVLALPFNAVNMMFGVQLGGKVSRPDRNTSVSVDFRNALMMQENDADWNFEWADKSQIEWAKRVGDAVRDLPGLSGAYVNEPDPSKGVGVYEDLFWGKKYTALQSVKAKWDPNSSFYCYQCVDNA